MAIRTECLLKAKPLDFMPRGKLNLARNDKQHFLPLVKVWNRYTLCEIYEYSLYIVLGYIVVHRLIIILLLHVILIQDVYHYSSFVRTIVYFQYIPIPLLAILASSLTLTCLSLIKSTLYPNLVIFISETSVEFVIFFLFLQPQLLQIHLSPANLTTLASHKQISTNFNAFKIHWQVKCHYKHFKISTHHTNTQQTTLASYDGCSKSE